MLGTPAYSRCRVALLVVATACAPTVAESETESSCQPFLTSEWTVAALNVCGACFGIDPATGVGTCRGLVAEVSVDEMAAALAGAVSVADAWQVQCPEKSERLVPIAEALVEATDRFRSLDEAKEFARSEGDFEVRIRGFASSDRSAGFGGLSAVLTTDPTDPGLQCCVGTDCRGADQRCDWPAAEGVPARCAAADDG